MVFALITMVFGAILGLFNFIINLFKNMLNFIFEKGGLFVKIMQSDSMNIKKINKFNKNRLKTIKFNDEI